MEEKVELAYLKLKSFVYYDNYNLLLKKQIAEFESENFGSKVKKLAKFLENIKIENETKSKYFETLLGEIKYYVFPKKFEIDFNTDKSNIINNKFTKDVYKLESYNIFIDAPIEIHIISILWILEEGKYLSEKYKKDNYAYRIVFEKDSFNVTKDIRLFYPYFKQYQSWRDNAINNALKIAENKSNVTVITLDIKKYYYNINVDQDEIKKIKEYLTGKKIKSKLKYTDLLDKIHLKYNEKIRNQNFDNVKKNITMPPIGLLSSGIIANWYLSEFDEQIKSELLPVYYGRYVDDILIVLSNTNFENINKENILEKYFVGRDIFEIKSKEKDIVYKWRKNDNIEIQNDKLTIFTFESDESLSLLKIFKKNIEKNISAFWYLPDDEAISEDFDENVYNIIYADSINKIRSITNITYNKYEASVFLSQRIKLSLLSKSENSNNELTNKQILTFFKGVVNLDFHNLWEKIITYFVIINNIDLLNNFLNSTLKSIEKIEFNDNEKVEGDIKVYLKEYLKVAFFMAISLNIEIDDKYSKLCNHLNIQLDEIKSQRKKFLESNLFRHYYIIQPLINYTSKYSEFNYLEFKFENYEVDLVHTRLKLSPRFINFNELSLFISFNKLNKGKDIVIDENFIKELKEFYNYKYLLNEIIEVKSSNAHHNILLNEIHIKSESKYEKIKLSLANLKVNQENILRSIRENPNLSSERSSLFIDILNQSEKLKSNFLVLPEVCIPFQWIPLFLNESRRKQRVIIGGIEHITINDKCYNFLMVCLPFEINGVKESILVLRNKNHYSPSEADEIKENHLNIVKNTNHLYYKFIYGGVHFGTFNCYELADINHRSIFKSEVDLLIASEYNKDINYFSNIIETISRDIHCYVLQVNSSDYGDSRLTQPSKTELKDIMKFKGGQNDFVVFDEVDLSKLRDFQSLSNNGQKDKDFKNTPPDYDHKKAKDRLNFK